MSATESPRFRPATVVAVRDVASGIRRVELSRPGTSRAEPGAHVDLRLPAAGRDLLRSYSVVDSSASGADERFALSVLLSPRSRGGSAAVHALQVGDTVACSQPLQNFPLRIGASRYVLLAGGIGITALAASARLLQRLGTDVRLVYAARTRARMAYLDELRAHLGDRLEAHVDDEGTPLDVEAFVADVARDPEGTEVYVCGPLRLMDAVRRAWERVGLAPHALRFETFGNSGCFDAQDFVVRLPDRGVETVVHRDSTLLEALHRAGVDLLYDCLKGECGLCRLSVEDVTGILDHRDVFLSRRQVEAGTSMCVCVSRVAPRPGGTGPPVLTLRLP